MKKIIGFFLFKKKNRMPVHVHCGNGEAKFRLEPEIQLEKNYRLTPAELSEIEGIIRDRHDELGNSRQKHIKA
ncbi:MAG: DUF4160 domain-containing protein [Chlorobium sp.]